MKHDHKLLFLGMKKHKLSIEYQGHFFEKSHAWNITTRDGLKHWEDSSPESALHQAICELEGSIK